jgi:hypothetical protein
MTSRRHRTDDCVVIHRYGIYLTLVYLAYLRDYKLDTVCTFLPMERLLSVAYILFPKPRQLQDLSRWALQKIKEMSLAWS